MAAVIQPERVMVGHGRRAVMGATGALGGSLVRDSGAISVDSMEPMFR